MHEKRLPPVVVSEPLSHDYHVMVKPIGGICNLQCAYCYYLPTVDMYRKQPGHSGDFRMSLETYEIFAKQYLDRPIPQISFAWQGGEPTLMGLEWFNQAMEIQKKYTREGQVVENSLQTNGTLLDDAWCEFFRKHNFLIGLSVDGPASYHDKYRRTPTGEPSHEKVERAMKLLLKHGVDFNSLVVLSQSNVHDPDGVYRFLTNHGLRHVQLIPLLEYDKQTFQPIPQAITGQQYGRFLCRIFDLWFEHNIGSIFVQIIEQTLAAHLGVSPSLCIHMQTCGRALILEHNGDVYACDHYPFPEDLRGNIHDRPLHDMVNSPEQRQFGRNKQTSLTQQCRECPYLPACNGGCCKHRILEPGKGVRPFTSFKGLTPLPSEPGATPESFAGVQPTASAVGPAVDKPQASAGVAAPGATPGSFAGVQAGTGETPGATPSSMECGGSDAALDSAGATPESLAGVQSPAVPQDSALGTQDSALRTQDSPRHNWFCEGYKMFFEHSFDRMAAMATALRRGLPARSVREQFLPSHTGGDSNTWHSNILVNPAAGSQPMAPPRPSSLAPRPSSSTSRIDRNGPCPCGSGLKYKKCCGRKI